MIIYWYIVKEKTIYLTCTKEKSYNRDFKPYGFKEVEEFEDELGWYTLVNLRMFGI